MNINWYPGHMAKTRRELQTQISNVDLVLELCDARLPYSSRNPDLDRIIGRKSRILILNKADLADPEANVRWTRFFRESGIRTMAIHATGMRVKDVHVQIQEEMKEMTERAAARGIRKTIRAMVVGVPNVGKSTFINRMRGEAIAKTGDRPGVTRSNQWVKITPWLEMLDTPGLMWPRLDDQQAAKRLCWLGSIRDEILPTDELAMSLMDEIATRRPEALADRFHITDRNLRGVELIEEACHGRGFLIRGGEYDYDRCFAVILDEFRDGKMGRITLEEPEEKEKPTEGNGKHG